MVKAIQNRKVVTMLSKKSRLWLRKTHRYTAVFLGIQLSFWILSGTYFAWIPIDTVRGSDMSQSTMQKGIQLEALVNPAALDIPEDRELFSLQVSSSAQNEMTIYKIKTNQGWLYYDAQTGMQMGKIRIKEIERFARADYKGKDAIRKIALIETNAPSEYRGSLPVYQIEFDDLRSTTLYLNPFDGQVLARRNTYWRIFDFLWMLHILDFGEREDFNNNLLRVLASLSFIVVISGYGIFFGQKCLQWGRRKKALT